jgi:ferrous iron transport protein A
MLSAVNILGRRINMKLDELCTGEHGRIISVGGGGALRRRLMDMGLTPGTRIYVRKVAPFGDPIEITLRGYEFTFRKEDASNIAVEKISGAEESENAVCTGRESE